jgi:hypothetical protein
VRLAGDWRTGWIVSRIPIVFSRAIKLRNSGLPLRESVL